MIILLYLVHQIAISTIPMYELSCWYCNRDCPTGVQNSSTKRFFPWVDAHQHGKNFGLSARTSNKENNNDDILDGNPPSTTGVHGLIGVALARFFC